MAGMDLGPGIRISGHLAKRRISLNRMLMAMNQKRRTPMRHPPLDGFDG